VSAHIAARSFAAYGAALVLEAGERALCLHCCCVASRAWCLKQECEAHSRDVSALVLPEKLLRRSAQQKMELGNTDIGLRPLC